MVPVTLAQLMEQKENNLAKQRELKEKRAKLKTFQGLPPVRCPSSLSMGSSLKEYSPNIFRISI